MKKDMAAKSKYFNMREMIKSETAERLGIDNTPPEEILFKLRTLMSFLDLVRDLWGKPIYVNSAYRCPELNKAVGGKEKSQHLYGYAADITAGSPALNKELFDKIVEQARTLNFDQLIDESHYKWIHISHKWASEKNRNQILHL